MKSLVLIIVGSVLGILIALNVDLAKFGLGNGSTEQSGGSGEKEPLYWVAPMDKNYRRDGPGLSPMGMDLVPVYEEGVSGADDNSITISPAVENNLGVRLAYAEKAQLITPINTVGYVNYDESRIAHIHSRVEGWIERLGVSAGGDRVSEGQILYELYSPDLVSAQEEFLAALRSKNRNLIKASRTRLRALGLTIQQIDLLEKNKKVSQTISVTADRDGFIIDLNVRSGMYIKPALEVMSVGSLDSVWVVGEVFERHAHLVQQGQSVIAKLNGFPDQTWEGSVNYVYPVLDPSNRTLKTRIRLINDELKLRPNMLVNLNIEGWNDELDAETLTIPRTALIKAKDHARVVLSLGDGRFKTVLVEPGYEGIVMRESEYGVTYAEDRVQIIKGLEEGDIVVTSAQFMIDSESFIGAELMRMQDPEALGENPAGVDDNKVMTVGKVEAVKEQMGMVTITHEPIPAWDWPTMKMDFPLADDIALSDFKPGDTIEFEIEKLGDWEFQISKLGADEKLDDMMNGMDMMDHSTMEHSTMDHSDMDHSMMDHSTMDHSTMDHSMEKSGNTSDEASE